MVRKYVDVLYVSMLIETNYLISAKKKGMKSRINFYKKAKTTLSKTNGEIEKIDGEMHRKEKER